VFHKEAGEVGGTAEEGDTQGGLGDDHGI
jgi:hypothetical protein